VTTILQPVGVRGIFTSSKRCIVKPAFGWLGRFCRQNKDDEHNPFSSEAWIYIASCRRMGRIKGFRST
jgi:transposase